MHASSAALAVSYISAACYQFEVQPLANPSHRDLTYPPRPSADGLPRPADPGLGNDIHDIAVNHYRIDR